MQRIAVEDRRQALLAAGLRVIARDGLARASTRAIAAEATMPTASFHYVFASYDAMVEELVGTILAGAVDGRRRRGGGAPAPSASSSAGRCRAGSTGRPPTPTRRSRCTRSSAGAARRRTCGTSPPRCTTQYAAVGRGVRRRRGGAVRRPLAVPSADVARFVLVLTDGVAARWLVDRDEAAARRALAIGAERRARPRAGGDADDRRRADLARRRAAGSAGSRVAWLGVWLAQLTVIQLLLPAQVASIGAEHGFVDTIVRFGWVSAVAGVAALIAFPIVGALSDVTVSRFGRRRPWIAVGTVMFAAGLLLLGDPGHRASASRSPGRSRSPGFAAVSSALTALIADQVPVDQRGVVSAFVSVPQAAGTIVGLLLVESLALSQLASYALVALVLCVLVLPLLLRIPDAPVVGSARPLRIRADHRVALDRPAHAPRLRLDPRRSAAREPRQRARHEPAALLPRRSASATAHAEDDLIPRRARLPRRAGDREPDRRPGERPVRPPARVRRHRRRAAGRGGAAARDRAGLRHDARRRRAARRRVRRVPRRRPGARDAGAARTRRTAARTSGS